MDQYQYEAIPRHDTIRLFELEPGSDDDPLFGSLRSVQIDQTPPYEAISYVWGNPAKQVVLVCDGMELRITYNLSGALRRVRRTQGTRLLWADAVCIDQDNVHERSAQVALMRSIFQGAVRVLVWLGPGEDDEETRSVFALLERLWDLGDKSDSDCSKPLTHMTTQELVIGSVQRRIGLQPGAIPAKSSPIWECLARFYTQPWFTRVWVLQEVAVPSSSALIMCGRAESDWHKVGFSSLLLWVHFSQEFLVTISENSVFWGFYSRIFNSATMWEWSLSNIAGRSTNKLCDLLGDARCFEATDPRDKVFALLGLPSASGASADIKSDPLLLAPDYTKSHDQIYRDVTRKLIKEMRSLDVLSEVSHDEDTLSKSPSWAPCWNQLRLASVLGISAFRPFYQVCSDLPTSLYESAHEDILSLRGLLFDVVASVGHIIDGFEYSLKERASFPTLALHPWVDDLSTTETYPTGEALDAVYSITLAANVRDGFVPADENLTQHLADFCAYLIGYFQLTSPDRPIDTALREAAGSGKGSRFSAAADRASHNRRLIVTSKGYIGLGPSALREGDQVCVLFGGIVPFTLRQEDGVYRMIGECYVHGLMRGEAIKEMRDGKLSEMRFDIH